MPTYSVGYGKTYSSLQAAWNTIKAAYGGSLLPEHAYIDVYEGEYGEYGATNYILYMDNSSTPVITNNGRKVIIRNRRSGNRKFSRWILNGDGCTTMIRANSLSYWDIKGFEFYSSTGATAFIDSQANTSVTINNCVFFESASSDATIIIDNLVKFINNTVLLCKNSGLSGNYILSITKASSPYNVSDIGNNVIISEYDNTSKYFVKVIDNQYVVLTNNIYYRIGLYTISGVNSSVALSGNQNVDPKLYICYTQLSSMITNKKFMSAKPLPSSPCIGGGSASVMFPAYDIDGIPRFSTPDIGAYEDFERSKQYTFKWESGQTTIEAWTVVSSSVTDEFGNVVITARPLPTLTSGIAYGINCDYQEEEIGTISGTTVTLPTATKSYTTPLPGWEGSSDYPCTMPNQKLIISAGMTVLNDNNVEFSPTVIYAWGEATDDSGDASYIVCDDIQKYIRDGSKHGSETQHILKNGDFKGWRIKACVDGDEEQKIIDYVDESNNRIYVTYDFENIPQEGDAFEIYNENEYGGEIRAEGTVANKITFDHVSSGWGGIKFGSNCYYDFIIIDHCSYIGFWSYEASWYGSGRYEGVEIRNSYLKHWSGHTSRVLKVTNQYRKLRVYNCRFEGILEIADTTSSYVDNISIINSWINQLELLNNGPSIHLYLTGIRNNIICDISYAMGAGDADEDGDVYVETLANYTTAWDTARKLLSTRESFNKNMKSGTSYDWTWVNADITNRVSNMGYQPETGKHYVCDLLYELVTSGFSGLDVYAGPIWYVNNSTGVDNHYRGAVSNPLATLEYVSKKNDSWCRLYTIMGSNSFYDTYGQQTIRLVNTGNSYDADLKCSDYSIESGYELIPVSSARLIIEGYDTLPNGLPIFRDKNTSLYNYPEFTTFRKIQLENYSLSYPITIITRDLRYGRFENCVFKLRDGSTVTHGIRIDSSFGINSKIVDCTFIGIAGKYAILSMSDGSPSITVQNNIFKTWTNGFYATGMISGTLDTIYLYNNLIDTDVTDLYDDDGSGTFSPTESGTVDGVSGLIGSGTHPYDIDDTSAGIQKGLDNSDTPDEDAKERPRPSPPTTVSDIGAYEYEASMGRNSLRATGTMVIPWYDPNPPLPKWWVKEVSKTVSTSIYTGFPIWDYTTKRGVFGHHNQDRQYMEIEFVNRPTRNISYVRDETDIRNLSLNLIQTTVNYTKAHIDLTWDAVDMIDAVCCGSGITQDAQRLYKIFRDVKYYKKYPNFISHPRYIMDTLVVSPGVRVFYSETYKLTYLYDMLKQSTELLSENDMLSMGKPSYMETIASSYEYSSLDRDKYATMIIAFDVSYVMGIDKWSYELRRLQPSWTGKASGYDINTSSTNYGVAMYVWNKAGSSWIKLTKYSDDTSDNKLITTDLSDDNWSFTDIADYMYIGRPTARKAWIYIMIRSLFPAEGDVASKIKTDYFRLVPNAYRVKFDDRFIMNDYKGAYDFTCDLGKEGSISLIEI